MLAFAFPRSSTQYRRPSPPNCCLATLPQPSSSNMTQDPYVSVIVAEAYEDINRFPRPPPTARSKPATIPFLMEIEAIMLSKTIRCS